MPSKSICTIDGCNRTINARGLCMTHYRRWKLYGDPHKVLIVHGNDEQRFWKFVNKTETCWLWVGAINSHGYGAFQFKGKQTGAHQAAYQLFIGEIPKDMQLDHLCRVRHCVNPAHLEPVTIKENVLRGTGITAANSRKTHCRNGHEYNDDNTKVTSDGKRQCRICMREATRRHEGKTRRLIKQSA